MSDRLSKAIVDLDRDAVPELVAARIASGEEALAILEDCRRGMTTVGERFQAGEYYLSELMLSAELFKEAVAQLEPHLARGREEAGRGRVLLCTMRGDIHDLGKNILATLLRSQAFDVDDLGVNVEPAALVAGVDELRPDIVGFSSLITTSFDSTREAIRLLEERGLRSGLRVMLGGGVTSPEVRDYVGADFQTLDAAAGVDYCAAVLAGGGR